MFREFHPQLISLTNRHFDLILELDKNMTFFVINPSSCLSIHGLLQVLTVQKLGAE